MSSRQSELRNVACELRNLSLESATRGAATDFLPVIRSHPPVTKANNTAEVVLHPLVSTANAKPIGGGKKRLFDVVGAATIIVLAAPLFVVIGTAIKALSKGPIVYKQRRVGFRGRVFHCLKFRSMVIDAEKRLIEYLAENPLAAEEWARDQKLRRDPRITPIGRLLRKTSLDELPQLLNVLRGDMSLVGPRPVVEDELARYGQHTVAYLSARPGMTGLWQVNGRNTTTYLRRTQLDAAYVEQWRLRHDVKIILKTIPEMVVSARAF
ncbi:MAG: sugar transferase [Caulobacterales bacterium]